jgi:diguanylate cyclase (GGDEF)-like protein
MPARRAKQAEHAPVSLVSTTPSDPEPDPIAEQPDLLGDVDVARAGISMLYAMLDELCARHDLDDAWLVVENPTLGRQVFRAGRRPIADAEHELLDSDPGLHTIPPLSGGRIDESLVRAVAGLALHLDVVRYEAGHDDLTGLLDRRRFTEQAEAAIAHTVRHDRRFCLVLLDLDGLKAINDTDGHAAGDALLRELGRRLRERLRVEDIAARVGGDEFAVILPELDAAFAPELLERVSKANDEAIEFSAGIARCPEDATSFDDLYHIADERLLAAKRDRGKQ